MSWSSSLLVAVLNTCNTAEQVTRVTTGNGKVSGGQQWPTGRHGYCGDAYDQTKWDVAGPLQTSYVAGQVTYGKAHIAKTLIFCTVFIVMVYTAYWDAGALCSNKQSKCHMSDISHR